MSQRLVWVSVRDDVFPGLLLAWQRPAGEGKPWRALVHYTVQNPVGTMFDNRPLRGPVSYRHWVSAERIRPVDGEQPSEPVPVYPGALQGTGSRLNSVTSSRSPTRS